MNISVVPRRSEDMRLVIDKCVAVLRQRRKVPFNKPNDFAVITPDQLISQFQQITGGITGAMVFIAALSLLIGGVGRDEHHARLGHRADARDRRPQGARRASAATSSASS